MTNNFRKLLDQEMTRQEFLAVLGFGLAAIFGFERILKLLFAQKSTHHDATAGYGSTDYGH